MPRPSLKVHGLPELEKALREIRDEMQGKEGNIVATSLRNSGKDTVLFAMVASATRHQKTGRLVNALALKRHPRPRRWSELYGAGVHRLGRRPAEGERDNPEAYPLPWYAQIIEYGGRNFTHPLKGFMRASAESNGDRFFNQFGKEAGMRIEKAAKKIARQNASRVNSSAKRS